MTLLTGRTALVTGAARGIGQAIVERFLAEGASVAAVDLDPVELRHERVSPLRFDLADLDGIPRLVHDAERLRGPIDVLVNCAAVPGGQSVLDLTAVHLGEVLRVNLEAPLLLVRHLAAGMAARGYGRIVNITSVHAQFGSPNCVAYDVSKAGLTGATRTMAIELSASGVLVNAVAPGFVDTRETDLESDVFRTVYQGYGKLPIRRGAQPAEIAAHVAWLASAENTYVSGAVLAVDGGLAASF